jgi:predicted small secreted protein
MDQYSEITGTIIAAAIEVFSLSSLLNPAEREVVIILVCLKQVFSPTIIKNKTVNLKPGLDTF